MVIEMKQEVVEQVVRAFKKLRYSEPQQKYSTDEIIDYVVQYFIKRVEEGQMEYCLMDERKLVEENWNIVYEDKTPVIKNVSEVKTMG